MFDCYWHKICIVVLGLQRKSFIYSLQLCLCDYENEKYEGASHMTNIWLSATTDIISTNCNYLNERIIQHCIKNIWLDFWQVKGYYIFCSSGSMSWRKLHSWFVIKFPSFKFEIIAVVPSWGLLAHTASWGRYKQEWKWVQSLERTQRKEDHPVGRRKGWRIMRKPQGPGRSDAMF